jgi:hypothetical protein
MASECFWGHEGDVLIARGQYEYFEKLIRFRNAHSDTYEVWEKGDKK